MRGRLFLIAISCVVLGGSTLANAATGRVIKVLPQFLDKDGRHALSPSLYERDAYQAYLRKHPEEQSGMRFAIQWKSHGGAYSPLKLRVEIRGSVKDGLPTHTVLETEVKPGGWFSHWTSLPLTGDAWTKSGEVTAWRATLWEGDELLSEQKSFLW
jgi:hypothetical protein